MSKELFVRPSNTGVQLSFKMKQIVRAYCELRGYTGNGSGLAMTTRSELFAFLVGARAALAQLAGSGIDSLPALEKELDALTSIVDQHNEVVIEER